LIGFGDGYHVDTALLRQGTDGWQAVPRAQPALGDADHNLVSQLEVQLDSALKIKG